MKKVFLFLSLMFPLLLMGQVHLIDPIKESPVMDSTKAQAFAKSQFNNWGIARLHFDTIIGKFTGKGIKICICDTGEGTHSDFKGQTVMSANFTGDNTVIDQHGHATHLGGIIHEIAPEASLMWAKVLDKNGSGAPKGVAMGIDWCFENGANLINLSLGSKYESPDIKASIIRAAAGTATTPGVIVVAAAGNDGSGQVDNIGFPGRQKETICIGSINNMLGVSYFSSSGPDGDVMAPGEKILSTYLNNDYIVMSGTSMATPFVTATSALFLQKYGNAGTVKKLWQESAADIFPVGYDNQSFWGYITPGIYSNPIDEPDPVDPPEDSKGLPLWAYILIGVLGVIAVILMIRALS